MLPERVFDAHLHIIDPAHPLIENQGYVPDPFPAAAYSRAVAELPVVGGAVVSGSFHGYDIGYLRDALALLGPGHVGVVNLRDDVSDPELRQLDRLGVRAVRFNLYRGGDVDLDHVERVARRVHGELGWHSEFYLDATALPELAPTLARLPQITIDHYAMSDDTSGTLLDLVAGGAVVKATGLGRIAVADPAELTRRILDANPRGLMFGTDLPSTRATVPYRHADAEVIAQWAGPDHADDVFYGNAARVYRLG